MRTLILGGTTEASELARALAERGADALFSYAGRTAVPVAQPLPTRVGGFGGVEGLAHFLQTQGITRVVDATHPFAAQISRNAVAACAAANVPLVAFQRPPWRAGAGDDWRLVADLDAAVNALPEAPSRVFLAIGKQNLDAFAVKPQHRYLLRLVDPPAQPLPLARADVVIARGPFDLVKDLALLEQNRIDLIVAKNAGGTGAQAKLDAARALGLPVVMIDRPAVPPRTTFSGVADVLHWLGHTTCLGV
ncbi:cobalt-precorrin-6A reductase [Pseudosulfitobacter sp. DSM 107133]|uniref:cobalt-precorrin-6A reductase n=1 Tax=Pseudosulfitobacter sp. DSM 107133 TaxID=2883100 RepID=UPI001965408F|nr:cobalt-precorrin-6A reductase [Pseudosulfitobacter sp. DSM 107133]UOA28688.1 Precorrin-6A reductase [Pseudosulfitobacter sp. DSM 107133]